VESVEVETASFSFLLAAAMKSANELKTASLSRHDDNVPFSPK
jgi:hypothetical protein